MSDLLLGKRGKSREKATLSLVLSANLCRRRPLNERRVCIKRSCDELVGGMLARGAAQRLCLKRWGRVKFSFSRAVQFIGLTMEGRLSPQTWVFLRGLFVLVSEELMAGGRPLLGKRGKVFQKTSPDMEMSGGDMEGGIAHSRKTRAKKYFHRSSGRSEVCRRALFSK